MRRRPSAAQPRPKRAGLRHAARCLIGGRV